MFVGCSLVSRGLFEGLSVELLGGCLRVARGSFWGYFWGCLLSCFGAFAGCPWIVWGVVRGLLGVCRAVLGVFVRLRGWVWVICCVACWVVCGLFVGLFGRLFGGPGVAQKNICQFLVVCPPGHHGTLSLFQGWFGGWSGSGRWSGGWSGERLGGWPRGRSGGWSA